MSERYTKLFTLSGNLYSDNAPVIIAAGALLKDNQTGKVLAQLKLKNITPKTIRALKVVIKCFDVSGAEIEGAEYQYLDLSAARNTEFGQQVAVPLPDRVTRSFSVVCTSVIFSDNSVWEAEESAVWESLPKQQNLENSLGNLSQQYRRDTSPQSRFAPLEYGDLWLCSCGTVNKRGESQCCSCRVSRNTIFSALNTETLAQHQSHFEAEEAEHKTVQEQETKKKQVKVKKIAIISSAAVVVIIVLAVLVTQIFVPMQKYNSAVSLMDAGNYEEAIAAFEKLGEYGNSETQIDRCYYEIGKQHLNQGDCYHAILAFIQCSGYDDSYELMCTQIAESYKSAFRKDDEIGADIYQIWVHESGLISVFIDVGSNSNDNRYRELHISTDKLNGVFLSAGLDLTDRIYSGDPAIATVEFTVEKTTTVRTTNVYNKFFS